MTQDLIKAAPQAPTILDLEPEEIVERAVRIATVLASLVRRGKMVKMIEGREYVMTEGWNAMGSLMGFAACVAGVRELQDGGFEACVEIRSRTGQVLSSASARCGMDEKRWRAAPAFSRRSMAITRATGKAYRVGFSWIMALANLSVTPAEDMPAFTPEPREPPDIPPRHHEAPHPADGAWDFPTRRRT